MRGWLLALALTLCVLSTNAWADDVRPSDQVVSGVVIRAAASTSSQRLGLLRPDQHLELIGEEPGWWRVRLNDGRTGFVSKRWTERIAAPAPPTEEPAGPLEAGRGVMFAHFVYVGQGAGAILEFPCGVAVIDTGGQYRGETDGGLLFVEYLQNFFAARPHLHDTIDVVFTTHAHADHLKGLSYLLDDDGAPRFTVRNVVDNGASGEGSAGRQREFREAVRAAGGRYQGVRVTAALRGEGLSNDIIDPIDCGARGDPHFNVLWGGWTQSGARRLGGEGRDERNPNQHSLVIRVAFGEASFLFTGDLEAEGIHDLLAVHRDDLSAFDVDIYEVGHHGSGNATTAELLDAMTPEIAVISVGDLEDEGPSTARDYAHPRTQALDLMSAGPHAIGGRRDPIEAWAFTAHATDPVDVTIDHAIYSTGWEGNLVLRATSGGDYSFVASPH